MSSQEANQRFSSLLQVILGQALEAAGYSFLGNHIHEASGRFTYEKRCYEESPTQHNNFAIIEFQHLTYVSSEWAENPPSRFTVFLKRGQGAGPFCSSEDSEKTQCMLSELVVRDFAVAILPSAQYWWSYHNQTELGNALAEAGHLLVGYGLPWLADELQPPTPDAG